MFKNNYEKLSRIADLLNEKKLVCKENEFMQSFITDAGKCDITAIKVDYGTYGYSLLPPSCGDAIIPAVKLKLEENQFKLLSIEQELNKILDTPVDEAKN